MSVLEPGTSDSPAHMLGDVNLFLTPSDEDDEGVVGELELMIAPTSQRRKGYGRATVLAFMQYITSSLTSILSEYGEGQTPKIDKPRLLQLKVKIGSKNVKSIRLFESIGFLKVGEGPNYFGELELVFEGFLGDARVEGLRKKYRVESYQEISYDRNYTNMTQSVSSSPILESFSERPAGGFVAAQPMPADEKLSAPVLCSLLFLSLQGRLL
ncbi:hypothetical protein JHW43_007414 [Diplocarpon mali]|nr:hypothetical protein JHW43_007414 [Diplocarpon mali]